MLRILVVDDSRYQRALLARSLGSYGDIEEAADGAEACEMFSRALGEGRPFDLVVMDILMPGMDGHTALRRMNAVQDERGMKAGERAGTIIVSSLNDPVNMMQGQFEDKADAYITKPFDDQVLLETLRSLELVENPLSGDDEECSVL